jgi:hypothetical protein
LGGLIFNLAMGSLWWSTVSALAVGALMADTYHEAMLRRRLRRRLGGCLDELFAGLNRQLGR